MDNMSHTGAGVCVRVRPGMPYNRTYNGRSGRANDTEVDWSVCVHLSFWMTSEHTHTHKCTGK